MSTAIIITPNDTVSAVSIAEVARKWRDALLLEAAEVTTINNPIAADSALTTLKSLSAFTIEIEMQRVSSVSPSNERVEKVNALAKELTAAARAEGDRISRVLGEYEKAQRDKAEDAKRAADAEAARIDAEAKRAAVAAYRKAPNEEAATRAADEIINASAAAVVEMKQQALAVAAPKLEGTTLRGKPDFEVKDIAALYASNPHLCKVEPNRAAIISILRQNPNLQLPGLRTWWESKVSV